MSFLYANNAVAQLSAGIGTTTTVIQLVTGQGALFPNPAAGQTFQVTLFDALTQAVIEITQCTARSGDQLTIIRGQEGTAPQSYLIGDGVALRVTAMEYADFASLSNGAAFSGTVTVPTQPTLAATTQAVNSTYAANWYAPLDSPPLTGVPTAPTAGLGTNTTQLATTAFAQNMYSPNFTGTPTTPTAAAGSASTQIANTLFVSGVTMTAALPGQTGNSGLWIQTVSGLAQWSNPYHKYEIERVIRRTRQLTFS